MQSARLFLATCVVLTCSGASFADDMNVGDFLSRCGSLKPVLSGTKDAELDDQKKLSWCTSHLASILEDYRIAAIKGDQMPRAIGICLPAGMTDSPRPARARSRKIGGSCRGQQRFSDEEGVFHRTGKMEAVSGLA
jgi:hypothetical protein